MNALTLWGDTWATVWLVLLTLFLGGVLPVTLGSQGSFWTRCLRLWGWHLMGGGLLLGLKLFQWLPVSVLWIALGTWQYVQSYPRTQRWLLLQRQWVGGMARLLDLLERGIVWSGFLSLGKGWGVRGGRGLRGWEERLWYLAIALGLGWSFLWRWDYPWRSLRYAHYRSYDHLWQLQQLLSQELPLAWPLPAWTLWQGDLALMGAIDPMQVVRFSEPLLGLAVVVMVGFAVYAWTQDRWIAWGAALSLGVYGLTWNHASPLGIAPESWTLWNQVLQEGLWRQWTGGQAEWGALVLLVLEADRPAWQRPHWSGPVILALTAPIFLVLWAIAFLLRSVLRSPDHGLVPLGLVSTWIALALVLAPYKDNLPWGMGDGVVTLPIALALAVGLVLWGLRQLTAPFWGVLLAILVMGYLPLNLPASPPPQYWEYEAAARVTLALRHRFPRYQWALAAPPEQRIESYGSAQYLDLATFIREASLRVGDPQWQPDINSRHFFLFVEQRPLVTYAQEPTLFNPVQLGDPTYRNYRLLAGRTNVQVAAALFVQRYALTRPNVDIFYRDQDLIVYDFKLTPQERSVDGTATPQDNIPIPP